MSETLTVCMLNGTVIELDKASIASVADMYDAVNQQIQLPPGSFLQLLNGGNAMPVDMPLDKVDSEQQIWGSIVRESSIEGCLRAAANYEGYAQLLDAAVQTAASADDKSTPLTVGPMPTILEVLDSVSGGQFTEMPNLKPNHDELGLLSFNGQSGDLLLPSLDLGPLLNGIGQTSFPHVTLRVGVNSDSFNRGLGVAVQVSAAIEDDTDEKGMPQHLYNGYGMGSHKHGNAVKFHPGMGGGQLRLEGDGGWRNENIGFEPANWTNSGHKLHMLEITVGADGRNDLRFTGTGANQVWTRQWTRKLFDGRRAPSLFAFIDLGGGSGQPLQIGPVTLIIHRHGIVHHSTTGTLSRCTIA